MPWPWTIPYDLAAGFAELDCRRASVADSDRWLVIKEWLEKHGIEAPDSLPVRPEIRHPGWQD